MEYVPIIAFAVLLFAAAGLFARNIGKIRRNIRLGRDAATPGPAGERWALMAKVAIGQSKMVRRKTLVGILHVFVYVGFLVVNIEVIEIVLDGLTGQHRILAPLLGPAYNGITVAAEVFMVLVLIGTVAFLIRRNALKVPRLSMAELKGWPHLDANLILIIEIFLIAALVTMNASDQALQAQGAHHYIQAGYFPVSQYLVPLFSGMSESALVITERFAWWVHIIGIFAFLNYLVISKHLHILFAFPNVFFTPLQPKGEFPVDERVKKEVQLMMDPNAPMPEEDPNAPVEVFGAKDVQDLTWLNLLGAYTCTECGRCTASCPQNITGKKLSPRKIMMDTRDRLTEVGKNIDANGGTFKDDGKDLHSYISAEELWACNMCNACYDACPVNINPMNIIYQMRQYLVMEQSAAPDALNSMFTNTENNGAPWAMPAADRGNWLNALNSAAGEA